MPGPCAGKQERQHRHSRSKSHSAVSASMPMLDGSPSLCASHYMPRASMRSSSWHTHSNTFGTWPYMSSEYSRERIQLAQQRKHAKELQVSEQEFIVPKAPLPLRGQCCFGRIEYDLNPYFVSSYLLDSPNSPSGSCLSITHWELLFLLSSLSGLHPFFAALGSPIHTSSVTFFAHLQLRTCFANITGAP